MQEGNLMNNIYEDIAKRTQGDIYIGVVGPVRTGKSTFIRKFMEKLVLPNIENEFKRERTQDEIPQSGSGKTIMTVEPKFVPADGVEIKITSVDNDLSSIKVLDDSLIRFRGGIVKGMSGSPVIQDNKIVGGVRSTKISNTKEGHISNIDHMLGINLD